MATLEEHAQRLLDVEEAPGVAARALAAVFVSARIDRLRDGDALCTEGEPGDALWFLMQGSVRVVRRDPSGHNRELCRMAAPALVGHMAVIDGSPRSASCIAEGAVIVSTLNRANYQQILTEPTQRGTALRRILLASLTRQLASANARVRDILASRAEDVDERDVDEVSALLQGYKVDAHTLRQLEAMQHVETEDARRNPKNPGRLR